jgi:hypothetical protein
MKAVTDAVAGTTWFHVVGAGFFQYLAGLPFGVTTVDNFFIYDATGMGSGYWVHEIRLELMTGDTPKFRPALLPFYQTVHVDITRTATAIDKNISATTWSTVSTMTVGFSVIADDILDIDVGPFMVQCEPTDVVFVRVNINQGAVHRYYPLRVGNAGSGAIQIPLSFPISYTSVGTSPIVVTVEASCFTIGLSPVSKVYSPEGSPIDSSTYGWASDVGAPDIVYAWARFNIKRAY